MTSIIVFSNVIYRRSIKMPGGTNMRAVFRNSLGRSQPKEIGEKEQKFNLFKIRLTNSQHAQNQGVTDNLKVLNDHKSLFLGTGNTRGYIRGLTILYSNTKGSTPQNLDDLKQFSEEFKLGMRNVGAFNSAIEEEYLREFLSNNSEDYIKKSNGGEVYTKNIDAYFNKSLSQAPMLRGQNDWRTMFSTVKNNELTITANWCNWARNKNKQSDTKGFKNELMELFNTNKNISIINLDDTALQDQDFVVLCEAILDTKIKVTEIIAPCATINNRNNLAKNAIESLRPTLTTVFLPYSKPLKEFPLDLPNVTTNPEPNKQRPTLYAGA